MAILAFDSAVSSCSAAVWREGSVSAWRHEAMTRGQSEALAPMIADVMAEADLRFDQLTAIAVTVGPGAFTGIRIGLAMARGLALAQGIPLVGLSTLAVVAAGVPAVDRAGRVVLSIVDSRRDELWMQVFSPDLEALTQPLAHPMSAIPDVLAGCDAAGPWERDPLIVPDGVPDSRIMAEYAASLMARGETGLPPVPLYLRPPDVTVKKNVQGRE